MVKHFYLKPLSFVLLFTFFCSSCVSRKNVSYFQAESENAESQSVETAPVYVANIKRGDILQIIVSSLSPEASVMFNPYAAMMGSSENSSNSLPPANGYLVDEDGNITLPLVGKVQLAGLSTGKATVLITQKLDKFLQQPTASLRILNYNISVMGEVSRPSVYTIPNERITLPEALSLAGDLTIFGKRKNIMVIREVNGKREFGRVDLTRRDLFSSPYYYLHSNDVVYVEANTGKFTSSDKTAQLLPIVISVISVVGIFLTFSR